MDRPSVSVAQPTAAGFVRPSWAGLAFLEPVLLSVAAVLTALALFALFLAVQGYEAGEALRLLYVGAYGSAFSWQNTLQRASPLMLTALCVALPARCGLIAVRFRLYTSV